MKHMKGHSLLFPELINKPVKMKSIGKKGKKGKVIDRGELTLYAHVHETTTAVVDDFIDRFTTIKKE
jgi:hypothetical protein